MVMEGIPEILNFYFYIKLIEKILCEICRLAGEMQRPETEVQCSVCEHPNFDEVEVMKDTIKISIMTKWSTLQGRVNWTSS